MLPDASLFVMWGQAKLAGVPERTIWSELYYSDFWQGVGAMTNSLPVFATLAVLAWFAGGRFVGEGARVHRAASVGLAIGASALLHVLTDLPLHHDDGHPHFWPFSDFIYASPVSYWDPAHHGRLWSRVEIVIGMALVAMLWRRFRHAGARVPLVLAALCYVAVGAYWSGVLGG